MSDRHGPGSQECRALFERLSEYLDGEIPADACDKIDGHMSDCPPCQAFLESLRRTVRLVGAVPDKPLPEELRRSVREAYARLRGERGERA